MTPARLGLLIPMCIASACQPPGPTAPPRDADSNAQTEAPVAAAGPGLAITAITQRAIPIDASRWTFDPDGRFVAADYGAGEDLRCGIWEIESGTLVREYFDIAGTPCVEWDSESVHARSSSASSADAKLRITAHETQLEFEVVGGASRIVSGCNSCDGAIVAWAPAGDQVATCNGRYLEVWNGETGKLVDTDALPVDGSVHDLRLAWTRDGLVVAAVHSEQIHSYALSSFHWPPDGDGFQSTEHYRSTEAPQIFIDPAGHWLIYNNEPVTLNVVGITGRSSRLGRTQNTATHAEIVHDSTGFWRVDAATQWLESFSIQEGDEYSVYSLELGWRATVAEPNPGVHRDIVFYGKGFSVSAELEIIGAASGAAVTIWQGCGEYEQGRRCESSEFNGSAGGCEVLDVSPPMSLALVDCGGRLSLVEARGEYASFSALPFASDASWQWGRGNWLALHEPGGRFGVVDLGSGRVVYERSDVISLPKFPLAAQHDLLAIDYGDHLEFVDGPSGERRIDIVGKHGGAAVSPDGKQVAVIAKREARVIDIASGATVIQFEVGDARDLAWRQDGAVLFYGSGWPSHSVDAQTGESLGELRQPILEVVEPGDLDPSWRWIHRPDGSFTRTLDFMRIEIGANWARTDSGLFDGELADLPDTIAKLGFRIGDDPDAVPSHSAEDLEPWLRKPGLIHAFFWGEALPIPRIPAEQAAKLEAKLGSALLE